ncbi:MAG TPA: SAM-dependent methyltransferase [Streptosporangiaceae bacterium]|nr:SAM-dependent methyltransferase [Streptosporangiaceae bacterium]
MSEAGQAPEGVETDRPSVARLYDFFLGGHHNYAADRELGRQLIQAEPNARMIVRENRNFLGRAVNYVSDAGIRQFIDLGSGIPTQENVHEIAQRRDPEARVIYVDNDQGVVAHSKHLLRGNPLASVINADLRKPELVLRHPEVRRLIDFSQPVGLLMVTVLHFIPDADRPASVVAEYAAAMPEGSYLAISHATSESAPGAAAKVEDLYKSTTSSAHTRTRAEIMLFFDGFEVVAPGLVYMPLWRHDGQVPEHPERAWFYAGVGRKTNED